MSERDDELRRILVEVFADDDPWTALELLGAEDPFGHVQEYRGILAEFSRSGGLLSEVPQLVADHIPERLEPALDDDAPPIIVRSFDDVLETFLADDEWPSKGPNGRQRVRPAIPQPWRESAPTRMDFDSIAEAAGLDVDSLRWAWYPKRGSVSAEDKRRRDELRTAALEAFAPFIASKQERQGLGDWLGCDEQALYRAAKKRYVT